MYTRRVEAVRQRLARSHLHGLLLTSLPNIRYLSGFSGSNALMLITQESSLLCTDHRYKAQAAEEVHDARVVISSGTVYEALSKYLHKKSKRRIGFEAKYLTVAQLDVLRRQERSIRFIPTDGLVEHLRAVKDDQEIADIERAARISDKVFEKILTLLRPGIRELDIAAEISYWHRRYGAESDGFEPIVASGERGALPHARASSKTIGIREMITIDIGCRVNGYHSDLTRTVALGRPKPELRRIYGIILDAQQRTLQRVRDGITARSLDRVAKVIVRRAGYGRCFRHSTGHGIGLEVHELPRVSSRSTDVLVHGSVITVEPGIYVPGLGGVRIEDDVVIGKNGNQVLSNVQKDLLIL